MRNTGTEEINLDDAQIPRIANTRLFLATVDDSFSDSLRDDRLKKSVSSMVLFPVSEVEVALIVRDLRQKIPVTPMTCLCGCSRGASKAS
ncbi:hypothetical protein J6590_056011 [Homalodisca vitripennis]|nr:hypothetical protein J6590_056011 [Homalodisca vitripennis]